MEHVGGYTAFSSDLTAFVHAGDNELTVQARDDREASQLSRGKQSSRRGGIWYTPQSGIWQTVWYEWVPENYVKAIRYTPDLITNQLLYQIQAFIPGNMLLVHIPLFFQLNPFVAQCLYHLFIIGSPNNIWLKHMHQRFLVFA